MSLMELIEEYRGTSQLAPVAHGIKSGIKNIMLDCDCVDSDCSTETYET